MWVLLEPEDVLLFRDSRPFTAGEDFRAEGRFPPLPPPVAGAIRSSLLQPALRAAGKTFADFADSARTTPELQEIRDALGEADTMGRLHLAGPLVCRFTPGIVDVVDAAQPLFPLPADLLGQQVPRPSDGPPPGLRKPVRGLPGGLMPMTIAAPQGAGSSGTSAETGEWLDMHAMTDYLTGAVRVTPERLDDAPTDEETRTGIEIAAGSRTVESGKFYTVQVQRPRWQSGKEKATGLLVQAQTPDGYPVRDGYLPLGGEGRSMYLRCLADYQPALDRDGARTAIAQAICRDEGRFRLYLATPGVFAGVAGNGVIPSALAAGQHAGLRFRLVALASGKPVLVGGWDLARGAPRPLRRAVPAGTVYYGQLESPCVEAALHLLAQFHFRTTLQGEDALPEAAYRAQTGFGLTLVGAWAKPPDAAAPGNTL